MASVGVLTLELRLENSFSLKDKRQVVRSLKDRLRRKFNVAIAEIDYQELWQRAALAAVTVSSDHSYAEKLLQSVEQEAASLLGSELAGAVWSGWHETGSGVGSAGARETGLSKPVACLSPSLQRSLSSSQTLLPWMSAAHYASPKPSARSWRKYRFRNRRPAAPGG